MGVAGGVWGPEGMSRPGHRRRFPCPLQKSMEKPGSVRWPWVTPGELLGPHSLWVPHPQNLLGLEGACRGRDLTQKAARSPHLWHQGLWRCFLPLPQCRRPGKKTWSAAPSATSQCENPGCCAERRARSHWWSLGLGSQSGRVRLAGGRSELLLSRGWAPRPRHLHQVLEALGVELPRQEAGSPGQQGGWAPGASRRCRKVGSAQLHFQQKVPLRAPPELPGGVGRKHGVGSDSSFHNMLGSLSLNHENERMRKTRTTKRMRTTRRKKRRRRRWLPWWRGWLQRWSWGPKMQRNGGGRTNLGSCSLTAGA